MPIPYLESPPEVINIDVGRQLFVDDFLIEETTLKRTFHRPTYYDELRLKPHWKDNKDLASLKGRTIRLKFYLYNAKRYAFQIQ